MCNHFRNLPEARPFLSSWREYIGFDIGEAPAEYAADAWPKRQALIVRAENGLALPELQTWGVPRTMPGKRPGTTITNHVTNVRNLASPFWRSMMAKPEQRCLVPFTSFAEPKIGQGREEHWFWLPGTPLAAFAGIWRPSEAGKVFAFLTCEPNPLVAPLHPKAMPVILHPEDYGRWLRGHDATELAQPFPSQLMTVE